ncbi:MAG TPA: fumarylacetoacetate hydrolase family protein [Acidimicrobiia bacterium]|nr:fumarylacetoacetate hydrolase family protein [Acidimicrobiia bacterium]
MSDSWIDTPAIANGIRRMLEHRSQLMGQGEEMIGWKLGFGGPGWLEKFEIPGPLVGFLPASRRHRSGSTVSVEGWKRPVAEPELAVYVGSDVANPDEVANCIAAVGPAIELADVHPPPEDLEEVLADNIFHRGVIFGEADRGRAGGDISGLIARIGRGGEEVATTSELEDLTGELVPILAHTVRLLDTFGEKLRAGEVVIAGSVVPPLPVSPGERIDYRLEPLGEISVLV